METNIRVENNSLVINDDVELHIRYIQVQPARRT